MRETFFVVNLEKNEIWGELGGIWGSFMYDWGLLTGIRQGIYFWGGIVSWKEHYYHYCLPPKCGCGGTVFEVGGSGVEQSPKICVITSSSCWEETLKLLSFSVLDTFFFLLFSFPPELLETFLGFFAV